MNDDIGMTPLGDAPPEERLLMGLGDPPAFLRRGMSVDEAERRVHRDFATARYQMLYPVRLRLRWWNRLTQDHPRVRSRTSTAAKDYVVLIEREAFAPDEATTALAPIGWGLFPQRHWRAFTAAVAEFNERWKQFVATYPLDDLHRVIDGYNRYYVLEKECAVRSGRTALRGFVAREKPAADDLMERFPPLATGPGSFR